MRKGAHVERSRRRWIAWAVGGSILAIAGVAIALLLTIGGLTGTVSRATLDIVADDISSVTGSCDVNNIAIQGGDVAVAWPGPVEPGDNCVLNVDWRNTGSVEGALNAGRAPAGVAVTFNQTTFCGDTIAPGAIIPVTFTVLIEQDGAGEDIVFDPDLHGLEWITASDHSGTCEFTSS